jgi:hypothetical protein
MTVFARTDAGKRFPPFERFPAGDIAMSGARSHLADRREPLSPPRLSGAAQRLRKSRYRSNVRSSPSDFSEQAVIAWAPSQGLIPGGARLNQYGCRR